MAGLTKSLFPTEFRRETQPAFPGFAELSCFQLPCGNGHVVNT